MALIKVEEQELTAAASRIEQVTGAVQQLVPLSGVDGGSGAAGDATAAAAIESFVGAWRYGLGCLALDAEQLAELLRAAANRYMATEAQIARDAQ